MHRLRGRHWIIGATAAGLTLGISAALSFGIPQGSGGEPEVTALMAESAAPSLPEFLPDPTRRDLMQADARLVGEADGRAFYAYHDPQRADGICFVMASQAPGEPDAVGGCAPAGRLAKEPLSFGRVLDDGSVFVVGLVADGYTTARFGGKVVDIDGNAFALTVPAGDTSVAIEGPAGRQSLSTATFRS